MWLKSETSHIIFDKIGYYLGPKNFSFIYARCFKLKYILNKYNFDNRQITSYYHVELIEKILKHIENMTGTTSLIDEIRAIVLDNQVEIIEK